MSRKAKATVEANEAANEATEYSVGDVLTSEKVINGKSVRSPVLIYKLNEDGTFAVADETHHALNTPFTCESLSQYGYTVAAHVEVGSVEIKPAKHQLVKKEAVNVVGETVVTVNVVNSMEANGEASTAEKPAAEKPAAAKPEPATPETSKRRGRKAAGKADESAKESGMAETDAPVAEPATPVAEPVFPDAAAKPANVLSSQYAGLSSKDAKDAFRARFPDRMPYGHKSELIAALETGIIPDFWANGNSTYPRQNGSGVKAIRAVKGRMAVSVTSVGTVLVALANDGSLWQRDYANSVWVKYSDGLPND